MAVAGWPPHPLALSRDKIGPPEPLDSICIYLVADSDMIVPPAGPTYPANRFQDHVDKWRE